jgi:phosphoglycerol transferase MdoB-like AlkP superfamily enzyme
MQKLKIPRYIQWLILTGLVFLISMTVLRLVLALVFAGNVSFSSLLPSFILGLRFDVRIVSILCMILFLIGSVKALHPLQTKWGSKISFILLGIFSLIFCFFYLLDFAHYAYLAQRLNGSLINYLDDAKISFSMIWQTYPFIRIIFCLVAGVLLFLWLVRLCYNYILSKRIVSDKKSRIAWALVFFLLLAAGIFGRVGQYPLRWSDAFTLGNDYRVQVALNPFQSFFSSLNFRSTTYDMEKVRKHYDWLASLLQVDKPDIVKLNFERTSKATNSKRPNVVLVICESFSAYKSSMVNNPLNTTPFFNEMVKQGIYFNNCFTPSYGTARGVWATITGIPDVQLYKTASRNPAAVNQHTIINDFKGYEKFYFLGGSTSWANIRGLLTNNIDSLHLYEEGSYKAAKIDVWGISDKNLFLEANKVLGQQQRPFFAVIQTADNHRPYTIPEEDLKVFQRTAVPLATLKKNGFTSLDEYNAFRYTDFSFQVFMEAARKEKYFNNTIFVFVGDHGIRGDAGELLPKAFTEQGLTAEHVPLLFYAPSLVKPAMYSYAASQLDILPTIGGLAGVPYTNNTLGRDLLKHDSSRQDGAFIIDPDSRRIGIISNNIFYSYGINGSEESFASIISNQPVTPTDSLRNIYRKMTDAYYETARYLLLNNKKRSSRR